MATRLMQLVSAVFHPLLMATYMCMLLAALVPEAFSPIPEQGIPYFILSIFITTFGVPALSVLALRLTRRISSLAISKREERHFPFFSIALFYGTTTYLFYIRMSVPPSILVMMVLVTVLIALLLVISFWQKISVHAAAIWGVCGIFSCFAIKYLNSTFAPHTAILFVVAGLVSTSRLSLGRHTASEVWSGAMLGFVLCFVGFYFFG